MTDVLHGIGGFVEGVNGALKDRKIDRSELAMLDHMCYRVETDKRYRELYREIGKTAVMIGKVMVAGRPVATFEFAEPVEAGGWRIPYLELPAPKDGSPYEQGLEHAEFVTVGDVRKFAARHAGLPFTYKERAINPELGLKTGTLALKFHEQPLGAVVRIERRLQEEGR